VIWWIDPIRIGRHWAAIGAVVSFAALTAVSFYEPLLHGNQFYNNNFVSRFSRSAAVAAVDLTAWGMFESDNSVPSAANLPEETECKPTARLPNIIMVLDESSFDVSVLPGITPPPGYQNYFRSFDNKQRNFVVEGAGGPTWFTEYNVLAGLARRLVDPPATEEVVAQRVQDSEPRYFTTYYAIDTVNFKPADMSSWLDTLDAAYLPLAVLEAAGVPLDPTFVEQKKILQRCRGIFYLCNNGAEARRFNRQLIDAGYISGF
jgi:hypothetical protein